jgi:hypothetical protein
MDSPPRTASVRAEFIPALVAVIAGVLLAILPHLIAWRATGRPVSIADHDELDLYLAVGSHAYYDGAFALEDPVPSSPLPSVYPWLQLGPGIIAARVLGRGPLLIGLLWRTFAGVTIAMGWYLLCRMLGRSPWTSCLVAVLLVGDTGLIFGKPVVHELLLAIRCFLGHGGDVIARNPQIHTELRLISPGLSLGYMLVYLALLVRARERPSRLSIALAGAALGILFYVYFYSWTAALAGLALTAALDAGHRKAYLWTATIGSVLGFPAVVLSAQLRRQGAAQWLLRSDLFVPISRTSEILVPRVALAMLAATFVLTRWRRPGLIPIWALAAAGLALLNHQVVTGLQIQNFHWGYIWGPALSILIVELLLSELSRIQSQRLHLALATSVIPCFAMALALRAYETTRTRETRTIEDARLNFEDQRSRSNHSLDPRSVVAGDPDFVRLGVLYDDLRPLDGYLVVLSAGVSDDEWDARIALDSWLRGLDREAFAAEQRGLLQTTVWGPWARDAVLREAKWRRRMVQFDALSDGWAACNRFSVRYVALPAHQTPPGYLRGAWTRLESGPWWQVWERSASRPH